MRGPAAFGARCEHIAQANICERASHNHLVVAAARAVGVEVAGLHAVLDQEFSGGTIGGNIAGRRDVIGGHRIPQHRKHAQAREILHRSRGVHHIVKIRRLADVRGFFGPLVQITRRNLHRVPAIVALEHFRVLFLEHFGAHRTLHHGLHFFGRWPDVFEVYAAAARVRANGLAHQIDVHAARQRVRHHQRRRSQIVRAHQRIDAPFEVAIAAQHRGHGQLSFLYRVGDWFRQRPAVADASGAAVTDQIEFQLFQIRREARIVQIVGDNFGAGREARFHPGLGLEALLDRFFRQQASGDHDRRI